MQVMYNVDDTTEILFDHIETGQEFSIAGNSPQNNDYDYHLVKNMNSAIKKIGVADIDGNRIKGAKYMVVGHANKYFVEMMGWMYVRYGQITP